MQFEPDPSHYQDITVASGGIHLALAEETAKIMGIQLCDMERKTFPNTECYVRYSESVRGKRVFIVQSLSSIEGHSVNDAFMEMLIMIDAAKRASAAEITVVAPYMAYGRQDRKARGREPISAATIIRAVQSAGADRLVSIDMHSAQTQATFNGPFDHLTAEPLIKNRLEQIIDGHYDDYVVVSPDGGRAKSSEDYAEALGVNVVHMVKSRDRNDSSQIIRPEAIGGVEGKICLIIDDIVDTAGTLVSAADALKRSGAKSVITCATHGLFSDPALERLRDAPIDKIIVTNSTPLVEATVQLGERLEVLSIASLLASAIVEIGTRGSVSKIFNDRNYH